MKIIYYHILFKMYIWSDLDPKQIIPDKDPGKSSGSDGIQIRNTALSTTALFKVFYLRVLHNVHISNKTDVKVCEDCILQCLQAHDEWSFLYDQVTLYQPKIVKKFINFFLTEYRYQIWNMSLTYIGYTRYRYQNYTKSYQIYTKRYRIYTKRYRIYTTGYRIYIEARACPFDRPYNRYLQKLRYLRSIHKNIMCYDQCCGSGMTLFRIQLKNF